jgi:hypothetical protein
VKIKYIFTRSVSWTLLAVSAPGLAHGAAALLSGLEAFSAAAALAPFERVKTALESRVDASHAVVAQFKSIRALAPEINALKINIDKGK